MPNEQYKPKKLTHVTRTGSVTVLKIPCKISKYNFLIDTGASCSVLPCKKKPDSEGDGKLYLADGTSINTYGSTNLTIDLGLGKTYNFEFIKAEVNQAIIGVDFLTEHGIMIDMKTRKIIDPSQRKANYGFKTQNEICHIKMCDDSRVEKLIKKYPNLVSKDKTLPKVKHSYVHEIPTTGKLPFSRPRRLAPKMLNIVKEKFSEMIKQGLITPSKAECCSPIHVVAKGATDWRICGDFRGINAHIPRDTYPIAFLSDFTNDLYKKKVFSALDLKDAYNQIPIKMSDRYKTTITTPCGAYSYNRLCYGLSNASQSFQRFLDSALRNLYRIDDKGNKVKVTVFNYIDDLLLTSEDEKTHEKDLEALFKRLDEYGLKLSLHKCRFFEKEITFLGHKLGQNGYSASDSKVKAILEIPLPKTLQQLKRALGIINFYHRFLHRGAEILSSLHEILRGYKKTMKAKVIDWEKHPEAKEAFSKAKAELARKTLLHYPSQHGKLQITTDASEIAGGGVIEEIRDGECVPLGFFSRKLDPKERLLSTYTRELLAIFLTMKHFKYLLEGQEFTVFTDHSALTTALDKPLERNLARESRMLAFISQYAVTIKYIKGSENEVADALSRQVYAIEESNLQLSTIGYAHKDNLIKAQASCEEIKKYIQPTNESIKLIPIGGLYCEKIHGKIRPFVPKPLRLKIFEQLHTMAHGGVKATISLICQRFVWPHMKKQIANWTKCCLICQKAKITRHNKADIGAFEENVSEKWRTVHVDLVGPLPNCNSYSYILSMIDRYTSWVELIPLQRVDANTVANAFILHWVARYGIPTTIVTDRGSVFLSGVFTRLLNSLGCNLKTTFAYTPNANGKVERIHRSLKAALRSGEDHRWIESMSTFLMVNRINYREEMKCCPSELVFGEPIRIAADLLDETEIPEIDRQDYADRIRKSMNQVVPKYRKHQIPGHMQKSLETCEYCFVRNEAKTGLQYHYKGPYRILERHEKHFVLQIKNKADKVSINRLKSAHILDETADGHHDKDPIFGRKDSSILTRLRPRNPPDPEPPREPQIEDSPPANASPINSPPENVSPINLPPKSPQAPQNPGQTSPTGVEQNPSPLGPEESKIIPQTHRPEIPPKAPQTAGPSRPITPVPSTPERRTTPTNLPPQQHTQAIPLRKSERIKKPPKFFGFFK